MKSTESENILLDGICMVFRSLGMSKLESCRL